MNKITSEWFASQSKRRRYLLGLSGGADSMALLHLLLDHGFRNLVVCHLDHRLRGRASTGDARFVATVAQTLGLPAELARIDVRQSAEDAGESIETAARRARHEFFADCGSRHRCQRVLLAHHADDQAETVLWNLLRGSHGPSGMSTAQEIRIAGRRLDLHRPLLGLRRAELRDYLRRHHIRWREDASNAEPFTARNRLRNETLPLLAKIAGRDVIPALARSTTGATDAVEILDWALDQARPTDPQGRLHLPALRKLPPALQRAAIHRFLTDAGTPGLDHATIGRCLDLLKPDGPPATNLPGGSHLRRRAGRLFVD